jgi:hypothetical protein
MDLIFNKEHAEKLRDRYTILELETITVPGTDQILTSWCVVPAEKVISEIDMLPLNTAQHDELIKALQENNNQTALALCQTLKGRFGGELDTFYDEIEKRINDTGSCIFVPTH